MLRRSADKRSSPSSFSSQRDGAASPETKRWPPRSKRHPSRSWVAHRPPTRGSRSITMGFSPNWQSCHAAASPHGPPPKMMKGARSDTAKGYTAPTPKGPPGMCPGGAEATRGLRRLRANRFLFLTELGNPFQAPLGDEPVGARVLRQIHQGPERDRGAEHDVDRRAGTRDAAGDLLDQIIAQSVDEHGHHRNARLADHTAHATLRGQQRVGVVVLLASSLGVNADEEAASPQERCQLVEAGEVE